MAEKSFLFLFLPYAFFIYWRLKATHFNIGATILLCLLTMSFSWGVFWAANRVLLFAPDASEAFASVEHIMRDVNYGWTIRYILEGFGWAVGLLYFWICWVISWLIIRTDKAQPENEQ